MNQREPNNRPLCFLHIGDTHLTDAQQQNFSDLRRIVEEANDHLRGLVDFAVLPGDIAEDGIGTQYDLAFSALSRLIMPWRVIPGDHDFKPQTLSSFYKTLRARALPFSETVSGCRCIYLDIVSAGTGGPDFRIESSTFEWLRRECRAMAETDQCGILFMHGYPEDMGTQSKDLIELLSSSRIVFVDTGHTHYNELRHAGHTIYAATRSVGQVEEGPVGYALVCVDDGAVSWKFKLLDSSWPFVMITSPADRRLALNSHSPAVLRATIFGASEIAKVTFRWNDQPWRSMHATDSGVFTADVAWNDEPVVIQVRATDVEGGVGEDEIEFNSPSPSPHHPRDSVGVWRSRHLFDTRLGPNCNGRKW